MRIVLGNDHAGALLEEHVRSVLAGLGHEVLEVGTPNASRGGWLGIAIANLVLAVAAVLRFPPLALVPAALGLDSAYRARASCSGRAPELRTGPVADSSSRRRMRSSTRSRNAAESAANQSTMAGTTVVKTGMAGPVSLK